MIQLKFNAAGRPTNLTTDDSKETVKDLLDYFDENVYHSELIRAANTLGDIDRCILAIYVHNDLNLTKTAKMLKASTQYLKRRLQSIYEQVRQNIDPELLDEELDLIHTL